ncbi:MAG: 2-hydroxyacyl-CoA dehydratase [Chloroflexi bacterium]|nr:2-hydroxyacyl-CoA dehydratase [Chloroflexota bacterium]
MTGAISAADAKRELESLVGIAQWPNCTKYAQEWKERGGKVWGVLDSYVPEEVLIAAGILPWRVRGSRRPFSDLALQHRPASSSPYYNHVVQSVLEGELDFLDGIAATDWEQDGSRAYDLLEYWGRPGVGHILHVPQAKRALHLAFFAREINQFIGAVEGLSGRKITERSLREAAQQVNTVRSLLMRLYSLRQRQQGAVSGAECLNLCLASMTMAKDEFIPRMESLLPYLESRPTNGNSGRPRLLVVSDFLDDGAFLDLVEGAGAVVAMDDLDTGSRYFWGAVDTDSSDILTAIAHRYLLDRVPCPRMDFYTEEIDQAIAWAGDFRVNGVLLFYLPWCYSRQFRIPMWTRRLKAAGIPFVSLEREYCLFQPAQLKTRIEAFIETLQ